jgi:hypothetical protein
MYCEEIRRQFLHGNYLALKIIIDNFFHCMCELFLWIVVCSVGLFLRHLLPAANSFQ